MSNETILYNKVENIISIFDNNLTDLYYPNNNVPNYNPELNIGTSEQSKEKDIRNNTTIIDNSSHIFMTESYHHHRDKNEKKEKKNKTESSTGDKVSALILMGGACLVFTYIFVKDKYVRYLRSGINKKMKKLIKTYHNTEYSQDIAEVDRNYNTWLKRYKQRNKSNFVAKIVMFSSFIIFGLGLFFNLPTLLYTGFFGGIGSGCWLIWKIFSRHGSDKLYYDILMGKLWAIKTKIDQKRKRMESNYSDYTAN